MKDGGTSVDAFFGCLADNLRFAVKHAEGADNMVGKVTSCPIAFCRAHHPLRSKTEVCGNEFDKAQSFTVLREPVSRLFSLFNYYKYKKKDPRLKPFATFGDLLREVRDNEQNHPHLHEFKNEMTLFWFAPDEVGHPAAHDQLYKAKKFLRQLDAIFFTEHLSSWEGDFKKSGLPLSHYDSKAQNPVCHLPHSNEADCSECADSPTEEEVQLATELNSLDLQLYEFAKTLPQKFS